MTAEIVVMNKSAIALAADSAVTINSGKGKGAKIYNSVNKLFALSKSHPVGIMIYGSASLVFVPWELIIKEYRDFLGKESYKTLPEYMDSFLNYIESRKDIFTRETEEPYFANATYAVFGALLELINEEVKRVIDESDDKKVSEQEIKAACKKIITEHYTLSKRLNWLPGRDESFAKKITRKHKKILSFVRDDIFSELPLSSALKGLLTQIIGLFFSKENFLSSVSGVVIAGFGSQDNFPRTRAIEIEGIIENKAKYRTYGEQDISIKNQAAVLAFAQQEEVHKFMNGIHPHYYQVLHGIIEQLVLDLSAIVENELTADQNRIKNFLRTSSDKMRNELEKQLDSYQFKAHAKPIIEAVSFLPKDELAAMAESLVNLTSFRHKMSMNAETVGGPIDVAVISRGDGFVWIKRKHYFDPELNHHFFNNYYSTNSGGICDEEGS